MTFVTPGGVLGFWGGVGSMGTVFLLVVLTQRYCCRRRQDKEEAGQVSLNKSLIKVCSQTICMIVP